MSHERYHDAAAAIRAPLDADPVVRIRPQFGYIDIQGKLGKASVAMLHAETEFVITGVTSDPEELADGETRIWLGESPTDILTEAGGEAN